MEDRVEVTHDNQIVAEVVLALYQSGGFQEMKLETMAEIAGIPLSDVFGAINRRFGKIEQRRRMGPRPKAVNKICKRCHRRRLKRYFATVWGEADYCDECRTDLDRIRNTG